MKLFIFSVSIPYVPKQPNEKAPKDIAYEFPEGEYCTVHGAPEVIEVPRIDDIFDFSLWPDTGKPPADSNQNSSTQNDEAASSETQTPTNHSAETEP